ncbi:ankyrin repeat domain-containing protein [Tamlana sp. 2_MG-2023]|uniref:ankyrin repeat domain-containing protein n=1 Tax=unclassified Tamlana TaxID=2614803 RepID=UPI0026E27529|nr:MULTISPECIES: ankyrin repeat domain-containing protein [unclassified Tamlana]MDO6759577.1 ankyrin repeat domain-containing protein [Tamlana sp. 2_MG-2023]MDO6792196.1 ankyrin repeat domain-containing protein [Tamlana sp. 1_MG-2023]
MTDNTTIKELIENGNLEQFKIEINNAFDINTKLEDKAHLLHYASQLGQNEIVAFLLDEAVDINAKSNEGIRPLHMAVNYARLSTVKLLLERGADIHALSKDGYQPIHTACFSNGTPEVLQCLIDNNADVHAKIARDSVALNMAIENNKIELVELLIANGADVNNIDETKFTPLFYAIKNDQGEILELLIKHGADIHHRVSKDISALIYCTKGGKADCIKPLIEAGYDYLKEDNGESPFHCAAIKGFGYVLQKAAESGVDLNFKDSKGKTMLDYTFENENEFAMKTLLKAGAKITTEQLQLAAQNGDSDSLVKLIEIDPDAVFKNKRSLIHAVIEAGKPKLLEALLEKSTKNINLQDNEGNTPLHFATYEYNQKLLPLLINAGADPTLINNKGDNIINRMNPDISSENILLLKEYTELFTRKSKYDETPMEYALANSYCKSYPAFAQIHFEMNDETEYSKGFTPIQMAAALGVKEALDQLIKENRLNDINDSGNNLLWFLIPLEAYDKENSRIKRIIDAGIEVNHKNNDGVTALMQASIKGNSWAREALLKGGADTSISDSMGKTPLHIVTDKGSKGAIEELLKYGANPDIKDNDGVTARDIATASNDETIIKLFSN